MEKWYKKLKSNGHAPANFRRLLVDALGTGQNHSFNQFVERISDEIESGFGSRANITPDQLIVAARSKYNNMDKRKTWNKKSAPNAEMVALMTRIAQLEDAQKKTALLTDGPTDSKKTPAATGGNVDTVPGTNVELFRTKYTKDVITKNGKTYWWCKHHISEKYGWNGLYCTHKPEDCPKLNGKPASKRSAAADKGGDKVNATLQLNDRLKSVLCTNFCMTEEAVDELFEQAKAQEN